MRSVLLIIIFLGLIFFAAFWFNESNPDRNDAAKVPGVGEYIMALGNNYENIWNYASRGPGGIWQDLFGKFKWASVSQQFQQDATSDWRQIKQIYQEKQ